MDSYEILCVTRESDDKEIEISFEDLKKKYDPNFNTSIRAYTKYREVLKAYEDVKNDIRRKMYDLKDNIETVKEDNKQYNLYDFSQKKEDKKKEVIDYNNLEEANEIVRDDVIVNLKTSYLFYLLNLRIDFNYNRKVLCNECTSFITCPVCGGLKAVYYKEKQVYCPRCHGKGKISDYCDKCSDGQKSIEEKISLYVDDQQIILNDLGNEYYDYTKSDLIVNFDFYDKENIQINGDEIFVKYYLSKEETMLGINRKYHGENGTFILQADSFVEDGFKKEIIFNGKKINFVFYNEKVDGNNKEYYLFINKDYMNKYLYFNEDYSKFSETKETLYFNEVKINKDIVIEEKGYEGNYGGKSGNLLIKCIFTNDKEIKYISDVEIVETSKIFNVLGGKVNGIRHYGFKKSNYLLASKDKYYLLSGKKEVKMPLKDYFMFKIISLVLLCLIPFLIFIIPYSVTMYVVLVSVLISYLILVNILMEVKI